MNPLDLAVITVVGLWAVFGFALGFIRGILFVAAVLGALAITFYGYNYVYGAIEPSAHNPLLSGLVAGGGTFIVSLVVLVIVAGRIAKRIRSGSFSGIDRAIGFAFGSLCACAFLSFAFLLVELSVPRNEWPDWLRNARSVPFLAQGAEFLRGYVPETMRAKTANAVDEARPLLDQAVEAQRAMRALSNPAVPAPDSDQPRPPTYNANEQREMNRLIGNQH
jgi:membrane protein required for colicin V production